MSDASEAKPRAIYLDVDQVRQLDHWCVSLRTMFNGDVPYLVGSVIQRPTWRDVDIRIMLPPKRYQRLAATVDLLDLHMLVSQWGKAQTSLPIDFQVQDQDAANAEFNGRRHARGLLL